MSEDREHGSPEALLSERVKTLGQKFLVRTRGQSAELREALARLEQGDWDAATVILQLSHKMHGTGATFGFTTVSAPAAEIERCCVAALAAPEDQRSTAGIVHALGERIDRLVEALDEIHDANLTRPKSGVSADAPTEARMTSSDRKR